MGCDWWHLCGCAVLATLLCSPLNLHDGAWWPDRMMICIVMMGDGWRVVGDGCDGCDGRRWVVIGGITAVVQS